MNSNSRNYWIWLCLMACQLTGLSLIAQQQVYFKQLNSNHGLSENVVNAIYQDSRGLMWFGTNDGLNKFDGHDFTIYKPDPTRSNSINSNLVFTITEDFHQRLWVGTTGKGLNYFDLDTEAFKALQHDKDDPTSLVSNQIIKILTDRDGRIWVATDNGVDIITFDDDSTPNIHHINLENLVSNRFITNLYEDKKGNIWIGTRNELIKIKQPKFLENITPQKVTVNADHPNSQIFSIGEDNRGNLIVGCHSGVYIQTDPVTDESFVQANNSNSTYVIITVADNIWTGSYRGVDHYQISKSKSTLVHQKNYTTSLNNPDAISLNIIKSMFVDNNGIIWIGTNGGGVNYFDPHRKPFFHYGKRLLQNGQQYNRIRSVLEDSNDYLWVGTEGGGLFHNQGENYESFVDFESSSRPFALAEINRNGKKELWAGSESAPFLRITDINNGRPGASKSIRDLKVSIFAILQDQFSNIWIGTYAQGIHRWKPLPNGEFDKKHFPYTGGSDGPADNIIREIYEDSQGNIWLGTGNGLNRISLGETQKDAPQFELFAHDPKNKNSLSHNYVLDIFESSTGDIWIGTLGGGLNKLAPTNDPTDVVFVRFGKKEGLPNTSIKGILEDNQGHLWISSNKGLSHLNPTSKVIKNYHDSGGLQGYEYLDGVATKLKNGALCFGGSNGFNIFHPEDITENQTPTDVIFTQLEVLNREVKVGEAIAGRTILTKVLSATKAIELNYEENNFSIQFAALDFGNVSSIKYQYFLEGFDQNWINTDANNRKATYTNLKPGKYTLKVKAANPDGIWMDQPVSLGIHIIPPWYLTMPAFFIYGLLAMGLLFLFRRYELINIQEKHELMLERLNKEKREELNQMKLQFFTNISHELRTPLTLIIAPLEQLLQRKRAFDPQEIQQLYHLMYKNSKYLLRMVNQLLDFRKLDQGQMSLEVRQGNMVHFIKEIAEPFQFMATKQQIDFRVKSAEEDFFMWFDSNFVEKIVYNLLSNAFKFTPEGGQITIELAETKPPSRLAKKVRSKHFLEIKVHDSGPGMTSKVVKNIFQRFYKEDGKEENKDGAGIGLAYTKSLVERHYGNIDLRTELGEGTVFSVILPMGREAFSKEEVNRTPYQQFDKDADPMEYFMPEPIAGIENSGDLNLPTELPQDDLPLLLFV
ncbi:MAG: two-component regulator propeller domain-containing protein, partial [Bacteroidota bacterium]